jgi:hypothetical protein
MAKVLHNQSLLDIAIQQTGTLEILFDLALANGISITEENLSNQDLKTESNFIDADILNYYSSKKLIPATELTEEDKQNLPVNFGIGKMAIGSTFIIR